MWGVVNLGMKNVAGLKGGPTVFHIEEGFEVKKWYLLELKAL